VDIFMEIEKRFEENKESLGGPLINDEHWSRLLFSKKLK
jgi:hypothetical protein